MQTREEVLLLSVAVHGKEQCFKRFKLMLTPVCERSGKVGQVGGKG